MTRSKQEIEDERWKNRRKMAWKAFNLASILSVVVVVAIIVSVIFGTPEEIEAGAEYWAAIGVILGGLWGVVMAYIGSAAYSEVKLQKP